MGYYQDVDEARGMDSYIEEEEREKDFYRRRKAKDEQSRIDNAVKKALIKHGITEIKKENKTATSAARGKVVEVKCKGCGDMFMARIADRKRGWGKFCSKSCKATKQCTRR